MGMTAPEIDVWPATDPCYRRSEVSAVIGSGPAVWERASTDVLHWRVKTESGFTVDSAERVAAGQRLVITARVLGLAIREPIEVVEVVEETDRVGFAYRTRPGHPVSGEESFIVQRDGDQVSLVVRSLTRAASQQPWRALFLLLLVAQRVARRRYLRSLR
ncbi:DUF1990 family protein [Leifsonia poae]|uniref:DUF1990 domain-containing protein n=1 Tax=Leifsonia poae TaxID=110933 RepID=A0A9W6HD20_9MICO|nr:DUF1990 family protein [Leifsonia poae]GLJ78261.1 hypothetical protein GCM10017584_38350 [Leifsonia poae]